MNNSIGESFYLLYANQPVIRVGERYYSTLTSFLQFMVELANLSETYRLVVPCKAVATPAANTTSIALPEDVLEATYYEGNRQAFCASFVNALFVRSKIKKALRKEKAIGIAAAGPSAFLFWCSFVVPKTTRYIFFIRGDKLQTVKNIYRGGVLYPFVTGLVKLFHWRMRSLARQANTTVFVFGEHLRKLYSAQVSVYAISPLIDDSFVRPDTRPDIPEDRPLNVLYVGRLSGEKNPLALIAACALAREQGRPFYLRIAGFGPLESVLASHIRQERLGEYVTMSGYVEYGAPLIKELDRYDMLCLCSFTEGIPGVVIEAFARGMPVLATRVGSLPSLFPGEIRFIEGTTPEDIWQEIRWCDAHRTEFSAMGRQGRKTIHRFLIRENAQRIHEIIQQTN